MDMQMEPPFMPPLLAYNKGCNNQTNLDHLHTQIFFFKLSATDCFIETVMSYTYPGNIFLSNEAVITLCMM